MIAHESISARTDTQSRNYTAKCCDKASNRKSLSSLTQTTLFEHCLFFQHDFIHI
jgi:hypothetical protein